MKNFSKKIFTGVVTVVCFSLVTPYNIIAKEPEAGSISKVLLMSEVEWKPLNPARGNKGPKAGSLWGNFRESGSSGFLVKFVDGFSSPPHIHNITYRGIVINGLIHNDDADAVNHWMPPGSYWNQPKGESHITSAKGDGTMAYIEIEEGPYLVLPVKKAFDSHESFIKVDVSNIKWKTIFENGPKMVSPWGEARDNESERTLVNLPSGFAGKMVSKGSTFRAVVIQGKTKLQNTTAANFEIMEPGSLFSSKGKSTHYVSCEWEKDCIIYIHTNGKFHIFPNEPKR